jgi:hypothetical protein
VRVAVRTRLGEELPLPLPLFGEDGRKEDSEGRPKERFVCGDGLGLWLVIFGELHGE